MKIEELAEKHQLGELVSAYGWNKPVYRPGLYLLIFFFPFVAFATVIIIGIPITILYLILTVTVVRRLTTSRKVFYLYKKGLIDYRQSKPAVILYEDIQTIWSSREIIAAAFVTSEREEYTVKTTQGKKHKFIQTISGINEIGNFLQEKILEYQIPRAIAQINQGEMIEFSSLKVSANGIHQGKKLLPWNELESAGIVATTAGRNRYVSLVIAKKDQKNAWAAFTRSRFPNLALFLTLIEHFKQT